MLRSVRLFRLFRAEQSDPDRFYAALALDAVAQLEEHVRDPRGLVDEMVRVTRPGGLIYLSFTNWYSPWGGHEMSPWHYLGPRAAERRYVRRHGRLPKNRYATTLFPVHIGPVLRQVRGRDDVEVIAARPRYYPRWCRGLLLVPGLREIATWNLLLILRRTQ